MFVNGEGVECSVYRYHSSFFCYLYFLVKDFSASLNQDIRIRPVSASKHLRDAQRGGFSYVTCEIPERQPGGFLSCQVVNFREKKGENVSKPE